MVAQGYPVSQVRCLLCAGGTRTAPHPACVSCRTLSRRRVWLATMRAALHVRRRRLLLRQVLLQLLDQILKDGTMSSEAKGVARPAAIPRLGLPCAHS